jgi:hypothetical protein
VSKPVQAAVEAGLITQEQADQYHAGTTSDYDWGTFQEGHDVGCPAVDSMRASDCTCDPWAIFIPRGGPDDGMQWWWLGESWKPRSLLTDADIALMVETTFSYILGRLHGAQP